MPAAQTQNTGCARRWISSSEKSAVHVPVSTDNCASWFGDRLATVSGVATTAIEYCLRGFKMILLADHNLETDRDDPINRLKPKKDS